MKDPLVGPMYKSFGKLLAICINVSLSAFYVGYSLVYVGTLHKDDFKVMIKDRYSLNLDDNNESITYTQALVQGLIPLGAMIGALLSSQVIKRCSRRNGFLYTNIPAFLTLILITYVRSPVSFIIGRLIQGICTGVFSAIVPLYINEIVTPDSSNLGTSNQIFIAGSQAFSFLWYFILIKISRDSSFIWSMLAEFPLITITIQTLIFLFVFPYETPKYLYEKGKVREAAQLITILYREQFVDEAINRIQTGTTSIVSEDEAERAVHSSLVGSPNKTYTNSPAAVFFAIHIAFLQQMSGVNAIVVYGKQTLNSVVNPQNSPNKQDLVDILGVLNTMLPAVMAMLTTKLMKKKGRKYLIQAGTFVCAICLGLMSLAFFLKMDKNISKDLQSAIIITANIIYMISFGLTLGPVVWLYIPEIVEPNILPISTMVNLFGATLCIAGFPILKDQLSKLPNSESSPAYIFVIFCAWCVVSLFINSKYMVETKDKTRQKVFEEYQNKKLC